MIRCRTVGLALAVMMSACGGDSASKPAVATTPAAPVRAATVGGARTTPCVIGKLWASCTVDDRLENAGLAPALLDSALTLPMFAPPLRRYRVGGAVLYVALYPDTASRATALAKFDPLIAQPYGQTPYNWGGAVTLIQGSNLAAVLVSPNEHLIERVTDALTAGLPTLSPK